MPFATFCGPKNDPSHLKACNPKWNWGPPPRASTESHTPHQVSQAGARRRTLTQSVPDHKSPADGELQRTAALTLSPENAPWQRPNDEWTLRSNCTTTHVSKTGTVSVNLGREHRFKQGFEFKKSPTVHTDATFCCGVVQTPSGHVVGHWELGRTPALPASRRMPRKAVCQTRHLQHVALPDRSPFRLPTLDRQTEKDREQEKRQKKERRRRREGERRRRRETEKERHREGEKERRRRRRRREE